ncbi:MAG TPA: BTAD domain-containing putative transcriptional regulator [Myxococcales bacterium]|jgi:DNA-binding SARP family transcriptional activator
MPEKRNACGTPVSLLVLGDIRIEREGERLALPPSKKTRALLGYLLVEDREHTRDELCSLFWELPDDPRGALRWSLSRLRPLLDEPRRPRLIADRDRVRIDPRDAAVDLRSVRLLDASGAAAGTAALALAAKLFRGELLEGLELPGAFRFQAWCVARREEARGLHRRILRRLAAKLEPEESLPVVRRLLEFDPADEAAHRSAMQLLQALGRPKDALLQYEACRQVLHALLGAVPGAETEAVRTSRTYTH